MSRIMMMNSLIQLTFLTPSVNSDGVFLRHNQNYYLQNKVKEYNRKQIENSLRLMQNNDIK